MKMWMVSYARVGAALGLLLAGCGTDAEEPSEPEGGEQMGVDPGKLRMLELDGGADTDAATPAKLSCPEDDPTTPGVECAGMVACGGTPEAPRLCDTSTSSCCITGFPSQDTIHCMDGVDTCGQDPTFACDGTEDCGDGEVCCLLVSDAFKTRCTKAEECVGNDTSYCHTTQDCGAGLECKTTSHSEWSAICM